MRGDIVVTPGLVLSSREHGELDRVAAVYTEAYGKILVRFRGVDRPKGKLKALAEPLVWGDFRLHLREGADAALAAGGSILSVFPRLRSGLDATLRGLEVCELLERLTPFWKPNPEKYALAVSFLDALDRADGPWLPAAFALRLLESAGFGVRDRRVSAGSRELWSLLHEAPIEELRGLPEDPERLGRLEDFIRRAVERLTERPLGSAAVRASLHAFDPRSGKSAAEFSRITS